MKKIFISFLAALSLAIPSFAAGNMAETNYEFTNYAEVQGCRFRMWVPPTTQKVKGVVVAFTQMQEWVSLDANLRDVCLLEDLAIVWADQLGEKDFDKLDAGLAALAEASGMPEIAEAPFATMAHSTAGIFCRTIASAKPERCFAVVQLNAVDFRNNEVLKDVPWLVIKNGSEETDDNWQQASHFIINDKEAYKHPDGSSSGDDKAWKSPRGNGCRMALVSIPDQGHFGWSPMESQLVSTFLRKAAQYQLSADNNTITRVPENQGWLTDTAIQTEAEYSPAAFADYKGDASKAFWHIDEEMALLWDGIHKSEMAKASQTLTQTTFSAQSVWQPATNMDLNNGGVTSAYPYDAASNIASNPIKVKTYYGIYKVVNGTDLYYSAARYGFTSNKDWITFYQEGTETERYAEVTSGQVAASNFPTATNITVTDVTDKTVDAGEIAYNVTGEADNWIVSGNVYRSDKGWMVDTYSSVPKSQVYIRHAGGNHNNVKETKFNITNTRTAQTVTFVSMPEEVKSGDAETISLAATSSGKDAKIEYYLVSGPATLDGSTLTTTGEEGDITVVAIASNKENNPGKAILKINVNKDAGVEMKTAFDNVRVFPTISEDIVNVNGAPRGARISVFDVNGRMMLNTKAEAENTQISVAGMASGIYFLTVDGCKTTKIIRK